MGTIIGLNLQLFDDNLDDNLTGYWEFILKWYSLMKDGILDLDLSVDNWSGVDLELRNMCLTGLVRTSGLYVCSYD